MKKSLIALAVAGVFVAPAAMADTTIYGQANVSFDMVNNGFVSNSTSTNHVASNQSRLGFKGTEDLGGGTSAIWQIEQRVDLDSGANTLATRNTFAGLTGESWGTVVLGQHDTPYKIATRGLDLFADNIADNRSIMGGMHDARLPNVAAYVSPDMSGLKVAIATLAGAETAGNGATKGSAWSLAAMYNAGPLNASLSYQTATLGTPGSGTLGLLPAGATSADSKGLKIGGGYTMDAIQLNAIYERLTASASAGGVSASADRNAFYLGGKYSFGGDAVKLAYTSAGKIGGMNNTEGTQISLGYDHSLSKRTTVYALYSKITNKSAAGYTFSQATSVSGAPSMADADPSVWSLGMKHSF